MVRLRLFLRLVLWMRRSDSRLSYRALVASFWTLVWRLEYPIAKRWLQMIGNELLPFDTQQRHPDAMPLV